jgi:UDP-N-acetylglucosamine 2-epimerase (non-hydrolysing)
MKIINVVGARPNFMSILFPCHPRTREKIEAGNLTHYFTNQTSTAGSRGIRLWAPLGYLDFLKLTTEARIVLTDSGGA